MNNAFNENAKFPSATEYVKLISEVISGNSNLDHSIISLTAFSATPFLNCIVNVIADAGSPKGPGTDSITVVVLKNCEP